MAKILKFKKRPTPKPLKALKAKPTSDEFEVAIREIFTPDEIARITKELTPGEDPDC